MHEKIPSLPEQTTAQKPGKERSGSPVWSRIPLMAFFLLCRPAQTQAQQPLRDWGSWQNTADISAQVLV